MRMGWFFRTGACARLLHRYPALGVLLAVGTSLLACGAGSKTTSSAQDPPASVPVASKPTLAPNALVAPDTIQLDRLDCETAITELRLSLIRQMAEGLDREFEHYKASAGSCKSGLVSRDMRKSKMSARGGGVPGEVSRSATGDSSTNLIVEGVDEADRVKHDGEHLYVLREGTLEILKINSQGDVPAGSGRAPGYRTDDYLRPVSSTPVPRSAQKFFLAEGKVILVGALEGEVLDRCRDVHTCPFYGDRGQTEITVLDVTTPSAPRQMRSARISGALLAARRIDRAVHLVVASDYRPALRTEPLDLPCYVPSNEAYARAKYERLKEENKALIEQTLLAQTWNEKGTSSPLCSEAVRLPGQVLEGITTVVSFDLEGAAGQLPRAVSLVSPPGVVHVGTEKVVLAVPRDARRTDVHTFQVGESPAQTKYEASGVFEGAVTNDFSVSLDARGDLRVVTARSSGSAVSVLRQSENGAWAMIGETAEVARGEEIRAARFDGDRAYLVTFLETDPLYVVDLSEPISPKIQGELKVPGFSTYLHPMSQNTLMSVGFTASQGKTRGLSLQMFDISRPSKPALLHRELLGTAGSTTDAAVDHQAFTYLPRDDLLVVPVSLCFSNTTDFQGLEVFRATTDKGFTRLGRIHHQIEKSRATRACQAEFGRGPSHLHRSVVVDGLIASVRQDSIVAQHLGRLQFEPVPLRFQ